MTNEYFNLTFEQIHDMSNDDLQSKRDLNEDINTLKIVKSNIEKAINIVKYFIEEE